MNKYVLLVLFSLLSGVSGTAFSLLFSQAPAENFAASFELLDKGDVESWVKIFHCYPHSPVLREAVDHTIKTNNLSCLFELMKRFDYIFYVAKSAVRLQNIPALKAALHLMDIPTNIASLFYRAFETANCEIIKILIGRLREFNDTFNPYKLFTPLPIEVIRADGFEVLYELLSTDFYSHLNTLDLIPFNYSELTEEEFLSLLKHVPEHNWNNFTDLCITAYRKACDFTYLRAINFITSRMSLQAFSRAQNIMHVFIVIEAIRRKNIGVIRALLAAGLKANGETHTRSLTYLDWAIREGSLGIIELLIEYGANFNRIDCDGSNLIIVSAIERGDKDIYKMLIENGAVPILSEKHIKMFLDKGILNGPNEKLEIFNSATNGAYNNA